MKKTLTESEHIRSMLQEMERPDSWYVEPDRPQFDDGPVELEDFQSKVYDYEKKFENLLQQAEQNPKQALKVFNDTRSVVPDLNNEVEELLPSPRMNNQVDLHNKLIDYIEDQVGEEEAGMDEPNPKTKSELKKLIQNRITIMKAINNFMDEHNKYGDISDYVRDKYSDDGSDAGVDMPEREPPKYYDGGYY